MHKSALRGKANEAISSLPEGQAAMAGKLVVIGGAEDQDRHCTILKKVLVLSGEDKPRVVVIAAAAAEPEEAGQDYEKIFGDLGAASVRVLKLDSRRSAQETDAAALLQETAVVFLTGGDQLRLTSVLGGTELLSRLIERFNAAGLVLAGTSAGASVLSSTMIISGSAKAPPQRGLIHMSPGLGLLPGVLIDQHFAQRGRFGRLLAAVALNPSYLGLGIDEDTAVVVREKRLLEVVGSFGISVVDGSGLIHTNVSETAPSETLTLSAFHLHILAQGARFDLLRRRLVPPGEKA
jgi:cyanophycinase